MPLSEHEQKLLEQLEQQLNAEDPAFAQSMDSEASSPRTSGGISIRHLVLGIVIAVVGLAGVLVGVASKLIIVGVVGFVLMGLGVYIATMRGKSRKGKQKSKSSTGSHSTSNQGQSTLMQKLERKWEERGGMG
ncbi:MULTISPECIES: DUF3040 domain-containing protein [Micrococcaceae]|uniref:DUF3040 domain-containing protein n=1 Tax=unclassified Kocuria TaxID=2649579 RepID=UPI001011A25E|nr:MULTISPECIES: DUF3040 domain-containing protein [unclassified Kocuria]